MRSWVEVSLGQIRANYRAVRSVVGAAVDVMAVVKADAYRHGAVEVSRALEAEGAQWLAVSNVEEGVYLRRQGIRARILVMADFLPEERAGLEEFQLTPVIHSLEDLPAARVPYHLKIDSGMGRLGTRAGAEEIARAVQAAPSSMEGLSSNAMLRITFTLFSARTRFDVLLQLGWIVDGGGVPGLHQQSGK